MGDRHLNFNAEDRPTTTFWCLILFSRTSDRSLSMQSVFNYPSQGQQASEPLNLRLSEGEATDDDEKGPSSPSDMPQFAAGAKSPMKLAASDSEDVLDSLNTALEWKGVLQMRVKTSDGMMLVRTPGTRRQLEAPIKCKVITPTLIAPRRKGIGKKKRGIEKKSKRIRKNKKRAKNFNSYHHYIYKVLQEVHPDTRISSKAISIVNSMVNDIFERFADEAVTLSMRNKRCTVTAREIQTAVRLIFPRELAKHAMSEGIKAVDKYCKNEQ